MIRQILALTTLIAATRAGIATSYTGGGIGISRELGIELENENGIHEGFTNGGIISRELIDHGVEGGFVSGHQHVVDYHTPAHYEFKYGVEDGKTGDRKHQAEVRVGDVVKGEYSLVEPDGTIRVVKYTADKHNGFNAIVSRIGHAAHPQIVHKAIVPIATHGGLGDGFGLGGIDGGLGRGGY